MGAVNFKEEKELFASQMFGLAQDHGLMPDISIDAALLKYSGLNSTAVLEDYSSQLVSQVVAEAPSLVASLGSTLAGLNAVPNAVGLGALIISFILGITISSSNIKNSENTADMLQRVFAEEKASSVRDSMHEYLKRLSMHVNETLTAVEETQRFEKQLSEQLTRLKNSMLYDNQMSSRSMKHWVNGAAFHSQMLVHAARLKMSRTTSNREMELKIRVSSISTVVGIYQKDLKELLGKYKDYKRSTIKFITEIRCVMYGCVGKCRVHDTEKPQVIVPNVSYDPVTKSYTVHSIDEYMNLFNNLQVFQNLESYFSNVKENMRNLIQQQQTFNPPMISFCSGSVTE